MGNYYERQLKDLGLIMLGFGGEEKSLKLIKIELTF